MNLKRQKSSLVFTLCMLAALFHCPGSNADVFDQITNQGSALIAEAQSSTEKIRQCTCIEQHECIIDMKDQALECIDDCWSRLKTITKTPDELRKCFGRASTLMDNFINCFESNVDACLTSRSDAQIQKVNINELIRLATERIEKAKSQLTKSLTGPIVKIIDTSAEFGICVKDCFVKKNSNGFCFDKKKCQPLLVGNKAKRSLRHCTRQIDFKREAGELCDCSVKAGLGDLEKYCPMLKLIGGRHSQRTGASLASHPSSSSGAGGSGSSSSADTPNASEGEEKTLATSSNRNRS